VSHTKAREEEHEMKVLIAVDDSTWSRAVVSFIESMAWPEGTEMIVLSAAAPVPAIHGFGEYPEIPQVLPRELFEQQRKHHEEIADRTAKRLRDRFPAVCTEVVTGDPREAIVDCAEREDVDLVVVGSHGRTGLKKLLLGSVSSHVVSHARCNVLVVKSKQRKE
jgi:nucleotide-binding universal stress UspA family protein